MIEWVPLGIMRRIRAMPPIPTGETGPVGAARRRGAAIRGRGKARAKEPVRQADKGQFAPARLRSTV